ncbi:MAG: DNA recombination protein RmuC [Kiritimatiellia bacterium]|jgi:DNA recombination protein RmuC
MSDLYQFISAHSQTLGWALIGFVVGSLIIGMVLGMRYRQALQLVMADLSLCREELARTRGQLSQMQQHGDEKTALIKETRLQLGSEFENLANRIFDNKQQQFDQQNAKTLSHSLDPLKIQITEFKQQVASAYEKENAERNKLIGKIDELQLQTQKIGADAVNLAMALKGDNKSQGNWGEVILERLLEESGLQKGREYDTQVSLVNDEGSRRNPDVIIYLPEDKQLVIDSKVSLLHYERYVNSDDEAESASALKSHVDSVRQHIKGLSRKNYESLKGIQTLDFVFIFMPIEAAFMLALQHEPALFREAYDKQIVLVSPTTLMATLRTVSNIWRYHKQHKNAELIATQAGGLYDQFALVLESLSELGGQLDKTQKTYQKIRDRLSDGRGNLIGRVEKLKKLGAKVKKSLPVDKHLDDESLLLDDSTVEEV